MENEWIHSKEKVSGPYREQFLTLVSVQMRSAMKGEVPRCGCCNKDLKIWTQAYQCFYCRVWFCSPCAETHFK